MKKSMKKNIAKSTLFLLIVAALLSFTMLASDGLRSAEAARTPIQGNYYISDYETKAEALKAAEKVTEDICDEGTVLLKNEGDALPLGEGAKISVFGKSSMNVALGGSGASSGGSGGPTVNLQTALTAAGFKLNQALQSFYNNSSLSGAGRGSAPTNGTQPSGYNTGETPVSSYTTVESSYAEYSDAALVVFSRIGGEGWDLPRTMTWNGSSYGAWSTSQVVPGARSGTDHYLQLDKNESDLLKYLGGKFNKVVVLLNTGSQFETGFLDDPTHYGYHQNTKAALWIGYPGGTGLYSLGRILKGDVNPSGKTVDTWARDFKADPTWKNFANNLEVRGNQYTNLYSTSGNGGGGYRNNYVTYKEGIYVGYRYYETRGFTDGETWYNNAVVYPFGYGLSYTTFTQSIISKSPAAGAAVTESDTVNFTVRVTNTGGKAGKEVVQLYYTAPYDDESSASQIEKSHVVLGALEKTAIIKPGEYEDVEISIKVRDMASYDYGDANKNGFKGYELDKGIYTVRIMSDAHNTLDSVDYSITSGITLSTDGATGNVVKNQFDTVSNYITDYFSRADFAGTFPTTTKDIEASQEVLNKLAEWLDNNPADSADKPYYSTVIPATGNDTASNGIVLSDLNGLPYDDPKWELFLDQLSADTMKNITGYGNYKSGVGNDALGIQEAVNADAPNGWANWSNGTGGSSYACYPGETVLASTWSKELSYEKGRAIGNEALFGNGGSKSRFPGWYAPAVNTHRSPFGGRNFEYYSEDGYLAGALAAEVVKGAQDKGVFCYVKHFAVNDQETNRCGLLTWASEQSMREIYLKPFEITVKVGGTRAMMSALNRIGAVWAGGSYELLTNVLRKEWGFRGTVVTDTYLGGLSSVNQAIRTGNDLMLGNALPNYNTTTATGLTALRNSTHGTCYTLANSMAINTGFSTMPAVMNAYSGGLLTEATINIPYTADLGTATLNPEAVENPDNSLIIYSLKEGSILPDGFYLSSQGLLTGTAAGEFNNYSFTVVARYLTYSREATFTFSAIDSNGSIVYQIKDALNTAVIGASYTASVATASIVKKDATPAELEEIENTIITYSIKNASALPAGLTLSPAGVISGTPTKECKDYSFTVVASASGYKDKEVTWTISVLNELTFTGKTLADGRYGVGYLENIATAEGVKAVTYQLKAGSELPKGLELTPGGYIAGIPTEAVTARQFTFLAVADYCETQEMEFAITIGLKFSDTSLPDGNAGEYYDTTVDFAQGAGGITYTVTGALPEGLKFDNDTNSITGTTTKAGVYTLTITASANGITGDEITLTLYIAGNQQTPSDEGCNGAISVSAGLGIIVALTGAGGWLLFARRKKETGQTDYSSFT